MQPAEAAHARKDDERDACVHEPEEGPSTSARGQQAEANWVQLLVQGCAAEAARDAPKAVHNFAMLVSRSPSNLYPLLRLASAQASAGQSAIAIGAAVESTSS